MSKTLILKLKEDKLPRLIILSGTRYIEKEDVEMHYAWEYLKDGYNQIERNLNTRPEDKKLHSILNSIVFQQRIYFCFEREHTRKLLKNDKNWRKPISGLSNDGYGNLIEELCRKKIIKLHDDTKKPWIYRVIHPVVLDLIKVDSEEVQLSQVIDFREKNKTNNKTDGKTDGKTDVDKEINRKIEKETESVNENNSCLVDNDSPKDKPLTFEQLLFREYPDSFPAYDNLPLLAQFAVENCHDFEAGYYNMGTFESHLKKQCIKITSKQKKHIKELTERFETEANKYYNLAQIDGVELRQPTELDSKPTIKDIQTNEKVENITLNVLKNSYKEETIEVLKQRISTCDDVILKREYEAELAYWENKN